MSPISLRICKLDLTDTLIKFYSIIILFYSIYHFQVEYGQAHLKQSLGCLDLAQGDHKTERGKTWLARRRKGGGEGEGGGKNQISLVQLVNLNSVRGKTKEHLRT